MACRNYDRAYEQEKNAVALLQHNGFWAMRTHASKGAVELIGVGPAGTILAQAKRNKPKNAPKSLRAVANAYKADIARLQEITPGPGTSIELWHYTDPLRPGTRGTWRRFQVVREDPGLREILMIPIPPPAKRSKRRAAT